jgi:hypothetical protein
MMDNSHHAAGLSPVKLDLEGFQRNQRREGTPQRFFFEHGVDDKLKEALEDRFLKVHGSLLRG